MSGRFKLGRSGNPKGRPRGSRNAKTVVAQVMNEKVAIRENGKTRKITKFEALVQTSCSKALKGDPRAMNAICTLLARTNQFAELESQPATVLAEDDAAILEDFLRRRGPGTSDSGREGREQP